MGYVFESVTQPQAVSITSGQAVSGVVDFRGYEHGVIITPSALDATTVLAFKTCDTPSGTFVDLRSAANAVVTLTVDLAAAHAYPIPAELAGAAYFQIWTQAAGANVNQTSTRSFVVVCKS